MSKVKDFYRCLRNLHRFTDGQVAVVEWDTDTYFELFIDVCPNGGLYEGGQFRFQVSARVGRTHGGGKGWGGGGGATQRRNVITKFAKRFLKTNTRTSMSFNVI